MASLPGGYYISYRLVLAVRTLLAALGVGLVAMHPGQSAPPSRRRRYLERGLIAVALVGAFSWTNFGALRGANRPVAFHDVFHYYIGAKYYPELEYTRIYNCTATAELDDGRGIDVARRWHRDLQTGELIVQAPTLTEQAECRSRFGSRWDLFRGDVEWFRQHMPPAQWDVIHTDYGFNATPTWSAVSRWMIGGAPVSARQIFALSVLDYVLLALMCAIIWRSFGPVVFSIATLWWALAEPTSFRWLGGAFLRHDALFCLVAGACALKTSRPRAAGAWLAAAVLLRAYPIVILTGLGIHVVHRLRQTGVRRLDSNCRALVVGFAVGSIALLAFTEFTWAPTRVGPIEPWRGFLAKAEKHVNTQFTNNLGLQSVLSFSQSSRAANVERFWLDGPWDTWKAAQTTVFQSRKWMYWTLVIGFLTLLVFALRHTEDWIALVVGVAMLPIATDLSNYYYSVLLLFAFLWPVDPLIGLGLAGVSLLTDVTSVLITMPDDRSVVNSLALILLSVWVTYRVGFGDAFKLRRPRGVGSMGIPADADALPHNS